MKFYYPTTTLNFDSILSSQMISPACLYKPDTLWWNRHEPIAGERSDSLILYSKCPIWDIEDPDRDNYPMVIEIDRPFSKACKTISIDGKSLRAVCIFESITFSMIEMKQGRIRFLFRSRTELERMFNRVLTGVGECKIANSVRIDCPNIFDIVPSARSKTFKLESVLGTVEEALKDCSINELLKYSDSDIKIERERGAELGYQVGRNAKFVRSGLYLDGYREPISYDVWRKKILPEPFAALIDKLCARPLLQWDPNRIGIAQFCKECWFDCFNGKKIDGMVKK